MGCLFLTRYCSVCLLENISILSLYIYTDIVFNNLNILPALVVGQLVQVDGAILFHSLYTRSKESLESLYVQKGQFYIVAHCNLLDCMILVIY